MPDQCKSKYQRIMLEYDVFKSSTNYPSKSTLDNSEWDRLIEERPRYAPQLRQLKERGFQHAEACAIITGKWVDCVLCLACQLTVLSFVQVTCKAT